MVVELDTAWVVSLCSAALRRKCRGLLLPRIAVCCFLVDVADGLGGNFLFFVFAWCSSRVCCSSCAMATVSGIPLELLKVDRAAL